MFTLKEEIFMILIIRGKNRFREDVYNKGANVEVACYFNCKVFTVRRLRINILNS